MPADAPFHAWAGIRPIHDVQDRAGGKHHQQGEHYANICNARQAIWQTAGMPESVLRQPEELDISLR
jgi:hypothetical protein